MRVFSAPHQEDTYVGIVHFKHIQSSYPNMLLVAFLVPKYARLARQTKNWSKGFYLHLDGDPVGT